MKNRKGFTLIEIMAVIVILSVLTVIVIPNILNGLNSKRNDISKTTTDIIYNATKLYVDENNNKYNTDDKKNVYCIKLETLVNDGKLVTPIIDMKTGNDIPLDKTVEVSVDEYQQFSFEMVDNCSEVITEAPLPVITLTALTTTTSSITQNYNISNIDESKGSYKCEYGLTNTFGSKGVATNNSCVMTGLKNNTKYYFKITVIDEYGNKVTKTSSATTASLSTILINTTPDSWSQSKQVTLSTEETSLQMQYKVGSGVWNNYTEPFDIKENTTLYGRLYDGKNVSENTEKKVTTIDTTAPTSSTFTTSSTSNSIKVISSGTDSESGIVRYQFSKDNGTTWTNVQASNVYTFTGLMTGSYNIKVRVINSTYVNNGLNKNYLDSEAKSTPTATIPIPTFQVTPDGWQQSKQVTITFGTGYTNEYSLDGTTWKTYTGPITITKNQTVYARNRDAVSNIASSTQTISQIDTVVPQTEIAVQRKLFSSFIGINSGEYGNKNLRFKFTVSTVGASGATIFYCVDSQNTCTNWTSISPETFTTLPSSVTSKNGNVYIRYKITSNTGISLSVNSFLVRMDIDNPVVTCSTNAYGYVSATCTDNMSGCINDESDSRYNQFGPNVSAWEDGTANTLYNARPTSSANLESTSYNDGLLLNSLGQVQYRNHSTAYKLLIYISFIDRAGNNAMCQVTVPKRYG